MPICKMARFRVKREAVRQCTAAIREFVTYVKAHEPGTRLYISLQDPRDRTRFLHVMVFKNAAAADAWCCRSAAAFLNTIT